MPLKQQQLGNIKDTKLLNIDDSVPENMFTVTHTHTHLLSSGTVLLQELHNYNYKQNEQYY